MTDAGVDDKRLVLSLHWDIIFPEEGTAVILNSYKDHYWIRGIDASTAAVLEEIQCGLSAGEAIAGVERAQGRQLSRERRMVSELVRLGILIRTDPGHQSAFSAAQWERYSTLGNWISSRSEGVDPADALQALMQARVAIVGVGGVGSLLALNLASSAVGYLTLIDGDRVEYSNLARQPLYREQDASGRNLKVTALKREIRLRARSCRIRAVPQNITCAEDALRLLRDHDIVVNSADVPRILVNRWVSDACIRHRIAAIHAFMSQIGPLYVPEESACFRCLEIRWRRQSGKEYDQIANALSRLKSRRHPSMVSGPAEMAALLCREVLDHITGAKRPQTLLGMLRLDESGHHLVRVARHPGCVCATR